jgi:hypothetical protein
MTPAEFKALRQRLSGHATANMAQRPAARLLGIGFRTLQRIELGEYGDPIPIKYALLIRGASKDNPGRSGRTSGHDR